MKKYLLAALLVLSASTYAANYTVFGGFNNETSIDTKYSDSTGDSEESDFDVKSGFTVGLESHKALNKSSKNIFEVGIGVKYDSVIIDKEKDEDTGEYPELASTLPIYASAKYTYKANNKFGVYVQGKAGYAMAFEGKAIKDIDFSEELVTSTEIYKEEAKAELSGGMYAGLGLGVEMGNATLGLSYDISKAELEVKHSGTYTDLLDSANNDSYEETSKTKYDYSKISLTAGYKFGK